MKLEKLTTYSICLCLFFLAFQIEITNGTLIILVFLNLAHIISSRSFPIKKLTTNGLIFIGLFALQAVSLIYTENMSEGLAQVQKQLLLLVIPLLFLFVPEEKENLLLFKRVFFTGGVFAVIYTLIASIVLSKISLLLINPEQLSTYTTKTTFLSNYLIDQFTYHNLANRINNHALYFANYLSFTCIVGLTLYFNEKRKRIKTIYLVGIITQVIGVFLLKSVTIILSFGICLLIIFFVFIDTKKNKFYFSIISAIIFIVIGHVFLIKSKYYETHEITNLSSELLIFFSVIFIIGGIIPLIIIFIFQQKKWIIQTCMVIIFVISTLSIISCSQRYSAIFLDYKNHYNNVNSRYGSAVAALSSIKKNPFLGPGIGDRQDELMKWYKTIGFDIALHYEYNEHNQYLRYWLNSGVLGLLLFLFLLSYNIKKGIQQQDYTLICLTILLSLFSLTESCLSRNKGMLFFIFILCLYDIFIKNKLDDSSSL